MQTPPVQSSASCPPLIAGSSSATSLATGRGTFAASIPEQQTEAIAWVNLPTEVLICIMQKIDPISLLMLSTTCQQFRAIYQDARVYEAQERRHHLLMYNLTTPALRDNFYAQVTKKSFIAMLGNMAIPAPNTAEWQKLRDQPLETHLIGEASSKAWVKNLYITAWDLLLQPEVMTNPLLAAELMKLLLHVVPHISNAEAYVALLFSNSFPSVLFAQLADIHVDRCIPLVAKHFPIGRNSPAYEFIVTQLPATLRYTSDLVEGIKRVGKADSFLFYCVKRITRLDNQTWTDMLFRRGCDVNQTDQAGQTLLRYLSDRLYTGSLGLNQKILTILQTLLQHPRIDVNAKNAQDESALDTAIEGGKLPMVNALLQHAHLNINTCKHQDISALYFAIQHNVLYLVQHLLITSKITLETRLSAFNYAVWKKQDEIVNLFLQTMDGQEKSRFINQAFALAINKRYSEEEQYKQRVYKLVKTLLQQGVDYDVTHHSASETLLIMACQDNEEELVSLLVQSPEININARSFHNNSALYYAVRNSNLSLVQILLQHLKIDVNGDRFDSSVLVIAVQQENSTNLITIVQALLQYPQIDVNVRDEWGKSALDIAIRSRKVAIVQALLQHPQIDVNARNHNGKSALEILIERWNDRDEDNNVLVLQTLLTSNIHFEAHLSAFNYAIKTEKTRIIRLFLQALDGQQKRIFINQALAMAIKEGQWKVAKDLRERYSAVNV